VDVYLEYVRLYEVVLGFCCEDEVVDDYFCDGHGVLLS